MRVLREEGVLSPAAAPRALSPATASRALSPAAASHALSPRRSAARAVAPPQRRTRFSVAAPRTPALGVESSVNRVVSSGPGALTLQRSLHPPQ